MMILRKVRRDRLLAEVKMSWNKLTKDTLQIPTNTDVLITDGEEVFVGFLDSMLDWRMTDQELCESVCFNITHWMEFPRPPRN